jgi:hypothetical protein
MPLDARIGALEAEAGPSGKLYSKVGQIEWDYVSDTVGARMS